MNVAAANRRRGIRNPAQLAVIAVAVCLAAASCGGSAARPVGSLQMKPCTVAGSSARCGTLIVPEGRLTGNGRTVSVRFVVIPATGPGRSPDPVVWFSGGPGDSAVAGISWELPMLRNLNMHRDLVFIDQRGTGGSNPLICRAFPSTLADKQALRASVSSCLAHLHGDLRFYTTAMFADDVDQVLAALHYAKANLIGASYGATAEQVFLLRHPGRVRTMTLLSGTLLNIPLFERFPRNAQLALGYVLVDCESQPTCHHTFPHLAADWAALWASLGTAPWVVPASQSPTGKTLRLDQDALASKIHELLVTGNLGPIPVVVHTLGAAKNKAAALVSVVKAFQASGWASPSGGPNLTMGYPIQCGELGAARRPQSLSSQHASFEYRTDLQTAQWWQYVCPLIPKPSAAAVGHQQLAMSRLPVLAFNGQADPQDPPRNMSGAQEFWPNSRELVVPGQGHDINGDIWLACLDPLTQTFVERASVAHLSTSCLAGVPTPPYDLILHQVALGG
jgi:pimeloyl-ACP methyl ester carboxylesterase